MKPDATDVTQESGWPFAELLDAKGWATGWALVEGPVVTPLQHDILAQLRRRGYRFIGMSSYMRFPSGFEDDPIDYEFLCEAWCHCFRDPNAFLRTQLPRALISHSDFTNPYQVRPGIVPQTGDRLDFVYVGAVEQWKRETKNWALAARCVSHLVNELKLTALVIGTPTDDFPAGHAITFRETMPWHELLGCIASSRFVLAPNGLDASPRVLAEALCLDVPIVVNSKILGGWKYVNRFTGAFFQGVDDIVSVVSNLKARGPRDWFRANYGPWLAGQRLLALVHKVDPALRERSLLRIMPVNATAGQPPSR